MKAKQEAEGTILDGCEPNAWVLSLLGNFSQGSWESKGPNTDMHNEAQWGGGGLGAGEYREWESKVCVKALKGQTGQGQVPWGCGMMPL